MGRTVHYIPVRFGYQHRVRPLVQGERAAEEVVLMYPAEISPPTPLAQAERTLTEVADFDVQRKAVPTEDFAAIVATGYDDILNRLERGEAVAINVASSPWALGAGYAMAAWYVLSEHQHSDGGSEAHHYNRDRVQTYYTEPLEYRVDELLSIAQQVPDLRARFETIYQIADDLRTEVEKDKQTIEGLVAMLGAQPTDEASLGEMLELIEELLDDDDTEGVTEAFRNILDGVESVTDGINTLVQEENRATLTALEQFGPEGIGGVVAGLRSLSDRPEQTDGEISPGVLIRYFAERLDSVDELVRQVETQHEAIETEFEGPSTEIERTIQEIETQGIAHGVRTFDGQSAVAYPQVLSLDLSSYQRAILYTLAKDGRAESIQSLTVRLVRQTVALAYSWDDSVPSADIVTDLRDGAISPQDPLLADHILPKIKSRVQYNLSGLETAGLVTKGYGRAKSVELTPGGVAYTQTHSHDGSMSQSAFEPVWEKVDEAFVEYFK